MPKTKNNASKPKKLKKKNVKKNMKGGSDTQPQQELKEHLDEPVEVSELNVEPSVEKTESVTASSKTSSKQTKKMKKQTKAEKVSTHDATSQETAAETTVETTVETAAESTDTQQTKQKGGGKKVRSFKVKLPNSEIYEGRFTGLTPYQAANKALSKYYRETKKPKTSGIIFSIKESTRGSKRSTYTYNGLREKLKSPVKYEIEAGKTIVKNFKNRLTKIKKAELATMNL